LNANVNLRKRFQMVDSPLANALFGKLGAGSFPELRVKEESDAVPGIIGEIRAFAPARLVAEAGLRPGMRVAIEVEPYSLPGGRKVWTVSEVFRGPSPFSHGPRGKRARLGEGAGSSGAFTARERLNRTFLMPSAMA
jgi:hypothetical protein